MPFELALLVDDMRVAAEEMPRFAGAYRDQVGGSIRWYFPLAAMTLAPTAFSAAERQTALEVAIASSVVGPRQSAAEYAQHRMVVFPSGKVFFANLPGATADTLPDDGDISIARQMLVDGSVTWEYTGMQVSGPWEWFLLDVESDLMTPLAPDSTDAYAGMLAAAVAELDPPVSWLTADSGHAGLSRIDVLDRIIRASIVDEMSAVGEAGQLVQTFQHGMRVDGTPYEIRFLADNTEAWRGLVAMAQLNAAIGSPDVSIEMAAHANTIRAGIFSLWEGDGFTTYDGADHRFSLGGANDFVNHLRFHAWPLLHGMLGESEVEDFGYEVIEYTVAAVPTVTTADLDTFVLSEWFAAASLVPGFSDFAELIELRANERSPSQITIVDAALAQDWNPARQMAESGGSDVELSIPENSVLVRGSR